MSTPAPTPFRQRPPRRAPVVPWPRPHIEPGDVFEDADPRTQGRVLEVLGVAGDRAVLVIRRPSADAEHDTTGRRTRISIHRLAGPDFRRLRTAA